MTWVILFSLVALVWVVIVSSNDTTTQVDLNEFKTLVENKDVELGSVSVSAIELLATLKEGTTGYPPKNGEASRVSVEIAAGGLPFVLEELKGLGIAFEMHKSDSTWMQLLIGFGPSCSSSSSSGSSSCDRCGTPAAAPEACSATLARVAIASRPRTP